MSVHPRLHCPHFHAVNRNLNKVMSVRIMGKLIQQQIENTKTFLGSFSLWSKILFWP